MSDDALDEEKIATAFEKLKKNMPAIGFFSRKKRIKAYISITKVADYMLTHDEISVEQLLCVLSLLMRKCPSFQKSAMMTALTLDGIGKGVLTPIGLTFILDVRKNLSLPSTHHNDTTTPPENTVKLNKSSESE